MIVGTVRSFYRSDAVVLTARTDPLTSYHGVVLTVWFLGIIALITHRFWDYWITLV